MSAKVPKCLEPRFEIIHRSAVALLSETLPFDKPVAFMTGKRLASSVRTRRRAHRRFHGRAAGRQTHVHADRDFQRATKS